MSSAMKGCACIRADLAWLPVEYSTAAPVSRMKGLTGGASESVAQPMQYGGARPQD